MNKTKIWLIGLLAIFSMVTHTVFAQKDINQQVANAITSNNAKDLASFFATTVNLTIPGVDGTYSKSQAEMLLKDFFIHHKTVTFKISHSGESREGARYSVGKITTSNKKFNVYFLMKDVNNQSHIIQFQVEETAK